jgi:hypothetical protein
MEALRDVLRGSLGRSLRGMTPADRLEAAWTIVCGPALAGRGTVVSYDAGTLLVQVEDAVWLAQLRSMGGSLARQIGGSSGIPVERIEFTCRNRSLAR